jgi:hypothetical protein
VSATELEELIEDEEPRWTSRPRAVAKAKIQLRISCGDIASTIMWYVSCKFLAIENS